MEKNEYEAGYFQENTPYVTFGGGSRHLVILEDLRVEHSLPQGLALQGLRDSWKDLSETMAITVLSRPRNLPEGCTQGDFADHVIKFIQDNIQGKNQGPVEILAQGISVPTALEVAVRAPGLLTRLWLVSGSPVLSSQGKILFQKLLEAGRHHRWAQVHSLLAQTMFKGFLGKLLGGATAALFSSDLGRPETPWDFLVTLQAVSTWELPAQNILVPMNIWTGLQDPLFDGDDWDSWLELNPDAVLELRDEAYGMMKIVGDEIRQGILGGS